MKLSKPQNQWALVVYHLIKNYSQGISMVNMCQDYFYKFQSRLGEVEKPRKEKIKIIRLRMRKQNRFGHQMSYINYKSVANKSYLVNLYNKLNRQGLKP